MRKTRGGVSYPDGHPKVVCLSGSTRFAEDFNRLTVEETLAGHIVIRPEVSTYDADADPQLFDPKVKEALDNLHLYKIRMADEVIIVNRDNYIGESTKLELLYALSLRMTVRYAF